MDILQEIKDYLAECKVFYLATVDGDQARVRPFGVSEIYNGRLYLHLTRKIFSDSFEQAFLYQLQRLGLSYQSTLSDLA